MIDCLILQIAPVLLGEGIPLFTQKEALKRFLLQDVKKYGQFAELIYTKILPIWRENDAIQIHTRVQ